MWGWGRPKRDLPEVNYAESDSDSEEDYEEGLVFDSPLVSPRRPLQSRAASPVLLAVPTLGDNVDDELEEVAYKLGDIQQVEEEIEDLTDTLEDLNTKVSDDPLKVVGNSSSPAEANYFSSRAGELVVEGFVSGGPGTCEVGMPDNQGAPAPPVNYDREDKEDGDKANEHARHIKVEFAQNDVKFWFSQLEDEMEMAGIGKQWLKKSVLQRNLPLKQKEDVKAYLSLQKENAGPHIYLDIKNELICIYAAKPCDSYRKALTRTMTGLPSQLGYQIIDDICKQPQKLVGCCCPAAAQCLWSNQLPVSIRAHISDCEFDSQTYKQVFEKADQVYLSSKQLQVAAVVSSPLDETVSAFTPQNQPSEVAGNRNRNNRGGARGGSARGGRGRNNRGGGNQRGGGNNTATRRGPRHSSSPPEACCDRHYVHGDQAWYCLAPHSCPWKDRCTPKQ